MNISVIWKLLVSVLVVGWALANLLPLEDKDFGDYLEARATANPVEYTAFLERAKANVNDETPLILAVKQTANAEKLDLYGEFFPEVNLVEVKNLEKRNNILVDVLYDHSRGKLRKGLDLAGGVAFTLEMDEEVADETAAGKRLEKATEIMQDRVNGLGVAEPIIRAIPPNKLEVQLPGLDLKKNPEAADELKKPARLSFHLVHRDLIPGPGVQTPPGYMAMTEEFEDKETGEMMERQYFITRLPYASGSIVDNARATMGAFGGYEVSLNLTDEGGQIFGEMTEEVDREDQRREAQGRPARGLIATVLDGKLYSAVGLSNGAIWGGAASITGNYTLLEAQELANVLNNPLEYELKVGEKYEVSPTLAEDARDSSVKAALTGAGLVVAFMILYYFVAGFIAMISVSLAIIIVLGVLMSVGGTLTLPGVAALVLTIGMAVDANILIFERIREELRTGKSLKAALQSGYDKAFSTIIDANVTTLITASILIWLGTGPVKGFGVTLAIGIGASMFGALIISRWMLELLVNIGLMKKMLPFNLLKSAKFTFLNYRKPAFIISWLIVAAGVVAVLTHRDHILGIDFRGGVELTFDFDQANKPSLTDIYELADANDLGEVQPGYLSLIGEDAERLKVQIDLDEGRSEQVITVLETAFPDAKLVKISENLIGGSVSHAITQNAFASIAVALFGILLYIWLRFEFGYGLGAVVATIHDLLMSIGIYVILGQFFEIGSGQFTAPMVAAVLMIVGYSINDTIVVFDRIREELDLNPDMTLFDVVNLGINRTLSRTLLTSITTLMAALALFIFGAGVVTDFALIFIIGIITGTFSSIFIASPVFFWYHKGDRDHVTSTHLERPTYEWETTTRRAKDEAEKA